MVWAALRYLSVVALAVILTGCRLTLAVDVVVTPDAGGTLSVSVTADAELEESAAVAGVDPLGRLVGRVEELGGGWSVAEERGEDGSRTVRLSAGFADPAEFDARYGELLAALDAPEARLLGPLSLSQDPDSGVITVQGELPLEVGEVAAADLGTDVATLTEQVAGVVSSSLRVRTPGPLVDASAPTAVVTIDEEIVTAPYPDEPATVTWPAVPGGVVPIAVSFEPGTSELVRIALFGGGALLALLLVAGGVLAQRRRDG